MTGKAGRSNGVGGGPGHRVTERVDTPPSALPAVDDDAANGVDESLDEIYDDAVDELYDEAIDAVYDDDLDERYDDTVDVVYDEEGGEGAGSDAGRHGAGRRRRK